jgi:hypothetical protein
VAISLVLLATSVAFIAFTAAAFFRRSLTVNVRRRERHRLLHDVASTALGEAAQARVLRRIFSGAEGEALRLALQGAPAVGGVAEVTGFEREIAAPAAFELVEEVPGLAVGVVTVAPVRYLPARDQGVFRFRVTAVLRSPQGLEEITLAHDHEFTLFPDGPELGFHLSLDHRAAAVP